MDLSIIIVNYNVREFLRSALLSVQQSLAHGHLDGEIIVIDNDSSDGSAEMVRGEFPGVRLFALEENIGFGRANNLGLRKAQGAYFLILNPDTILGEDTLEVMTRFMREHPEAGLAGCKLLNADGSFQLSCRRGFPTPWASFAKLFGLARLLPNSKLFAKYNLTYLPEDQTYEVDALGGAFMMFSRTAYEKVGGFDEQYFMYGEDLDLCYQVKRAGLKVYYVHDTATIHFKGESTRRSRLNERKIFYDAMHLFVRKNYRASFIFLALLRIGILVRGWLAVIKKHRGMLALMALDFLAVAASVLVTCKLLRGNWFGLPAQDYPYALIAPAVFVVGVLLGINAYSYENRRRVREVLFATPAALVLLSSLTYFFKEYASSRSLVLSTITASMLLLIIIRIVMRIADRIRFGGVGSARPHMRRTLVVGSTPEALRIGRLVERTQFSLHYQLVGFAAASLKQEGERILENVPILGDLSMLGKIVRDERITDVIFANDAVQYSEMLEIMQRVSEENPSRMINFHVVPTATDVLLGKKKIEVLQPNEHRDGAVDGMALIPIKYNVQRLSHRAVKRVTDIGIACVMLPCAWVASIVRPGVAIKSLVEEYQRVLHGDLSIVGVAGVKSRSKHISKPGLTSLARITLASLQNAPEEDIEQLDLYYAQNHSFGMDVEIILRSLFSR